MGLPARRPAAARARPGGTTARPASAPAPQAPVKRTLVKGELLFAEGENSRAMYFLKSGIIRIFKKKGSSDIEIDTIHSGQILGELAFLDGQSRSASAEALTDCELVEISAAMFTQTLSRMPDWLKLLLKTIVGRLRTASTRLRQLEQASTAYDYSAKGGGRTAHYVYLSSIDSLKIASAVLLVATRNGEQVENGLKIKIGLLQRYANQIMGVPVAKITTFMDVLSQVGIAAINDDTSGDTDVIVTDVDFLERTIAYMNEENLMEPSKRHDLSLKGFFIMSLVTKHLHSFKKDEVTGQTTVNLADVINAERTPEGRDPFRLDDFPELVKLGYATNAAVKSNDEMLTTLDAEKFMRAYRLQRVAKAIEAVNEQKQASGGSGGR